MTGKKVSFDPALLRAFVEPATIYAVQKVVWGGFYSALHRAVWRHARLGLVRVDHVEASEKGGTKTFWVLTERGRRLLELFPEKDVDDSLLEAVE